MLKVEARKVRDDKQWKEETGWKPDETSHSVEVRLEMAEEMYQQKAEKEANEKRRNGTEAKAPREIPGVFGKNGEIRQCNEGE